MASVSSRGILGHVVTQLIFITCSNVFCSSRGSSTKLHGHDSQNTKNAYFSNAVQGVLFPTIFAYMLLIPDKSTIQSLISLYSTAVTVVGLLWTRYKRPELPRPFKLPIFIPVLFLLISLYLTISPFIKKPLESFISPFLVLTGIPMYLFFIRFKCTPKVVSVFFDWIAVKTQQVLNIRYPTTVVEIGS